MSRRTKLIDKETPDNLFPPLRYGSPSNSPVNRPPLVKRPVYPPAVQIKDTVSAAATRRYRRLTSRVPQIIYSHHSDLVPPRAQVGLESIMPMLAVSVIPPLLVDYDQLPSKVHPRPNSTLLNLNVFDLQLSKVPTRSVPLLQ